MDKPKKQSQKYYISITANFTASVLQSYFHFLYEFSRVNAENVVVIIHYLSDGFTVTALCLQGFSLQVMCTYYTANGFNTR